MPLGQLKVPWQRSVSLCPGSGWTQVPSGQATIPRPQESERLQEGLQRPSEQSVPKRQGESMSSKELLTRLGKRNSVSECSFARSCEVTFTTERQDSFRPTHSPEGHRLGLKDWHAGMKPQNTASWKRPLLQSVKGKGCEGNTCSIFSQCQNQKDCRVTCSEDSTETSTLSVSA